MPSSSESFPGLELLRERLRDMTDAELLAYGKSAHELCSPATSRGKPPKQAYVIQLEEVRAEWRRRHKDADL